MITKEEVANLRALFERAHSHRGRMSDTKVVLEYCQEVEKHLPDLLRIAEESLDN